MAGNYFKPFFVCIVKHDRAKLRMQSPGSDMHNSVYDRFKTLGFRYCGSDFLKGLHSPPLPPGVAFVLLFGFRGEETISGALSDSGVLMSSMLDNDMQRAASKVYGFDEDHGTILKSPALIQELNRIFDEAE